MIIPANIANIILQAIKPQWFLIGTHWLLDCTEDCDSILSLIKCGTELQSWCHRAICTNNVVGNQRVYSSVSGKLSAVHDVRTDVWVIVFRMLRTKRAMRMGRPGVERVTIIRDWVLKVLLSMKHCKWKTLWISKSPTDKGKMTHPDDSVGFCAIVPLTQQPNHPLHYPPAVRLWLRPTLVFCSCPETYVTHVR